MNTTALLILAWAAPKELIVVAVIALILFGGTRLPQIGRLLGKSLVEFRKGLKEAKDEFTDAASDASGGGDDDNKANPPQNQQNCCSDEDNDYDSTDPSSDIPEEKA